MTVILGYFLGFLFGIYKSVSVGFWFIFGGDINIWGKLGIWIILI